MGRSSTSGPRGRVRRNRDLHGSKLEGDGCGAQLRGMGGPSRAAHPFGAQPAGARLYFGSFTFSYLSNTTLTILPSTFSTFCM